MTRDSSSSGVFVLGPTHRYIDSLPFVRSNELLLGKGLLATWGKNVGRYRAALHPDALPRR